MRRFVRRCTRAILLLAVNPLIFCADLISERNLEVIGEDSPGVSFDFEVGAGFGVFFEVGAVSYTHLTLPTTPYV